MTNSIWPACVGPRLRRMLRLALVLAVTAWIAPSIARGQGAKGKKAATGPETITGKIIDLERKGKSVNLTVEKSDGEKLVVLVNPQMQPTISARADASVLLPRFVVASDSLVSSNMELFGKTFDVYPDESPPPHFERDSKTEGVYRICGQLVAIEPGAVTLNCGDATTKVNFEQGQTLEVTVRSQDTKWVEKGDAIELEGVTRGEKFVASRVAITLDRALTAADFADNKDKKTAKGKAAPKPAKTPAKKPAGKP